MQILITNQQKLIPIDKASVCKTVSEAMYFLEAECDEISIQFVSSKKIAELHALFFNDPTPTDCITFPCSFAPHEPYKVLGEVVICPEIAYEYAKKRNEDPYLETTLYLVHGLLHLLGYDDMEPSKKKKMRAMEKKCMNYLQMASATIQQSKKKSCKKHS